MNRLPKWLRRVLLFIAAVFLLVCLSSVLNTESRFFSAFVGIPLLVYLFYFRPKLEERKEFAQNSAQIIGIIDGLYLANGDFYPGDVRTSALHHLERSKSLPGNEPTLTYVSHDGWNYQAFPSDIALFAVICVLLYAHSIQKDSLIEQYEHMLESARKGI